MGERREEKEKRESASRSDGGWWFLDRNSWIMLSSTAGVVSWSCPGAGQVRRLLTFKLLLMSWFQYSRWTCFFLNLFISLFSAAFPFGVHKSCAPPLGGMSTSLLLLQHQAAYNLPVSEIFPLEIRKFVESYLLSSEIKRGWVTLFTLQSHHVLLSQILHRASYLQKYPDEVHWYGLAYMKTSKVLCSDFCPPFLTLLDLRSVQAPNHFKRFLLQNISLSSIFCLYLQWTWVVGGIGTNQALCGKVSIKLSHGSSGGDLEKEKSLMSPSRASGIWRFYWSWRIQF